MAVLASPFIALVSYLIYRDNCLRNVSNDLTLIVPEFGFTETHNGQYNHLLAVWRETQKQTLVGRRKRVNKASFTS